MKLTTPPRQVVSAQAMALSAWSYRSTTMSRSFASSPGRSTLTVGGLLEVRDESSRLTPQQKDVRPKQCETQNFRHSEEWTSSRCRNHLSQYFYYLTVSSRAFRVVNLGLVPLAWRCMRCRCSYKSKTQVSQRACAHPFSLPFHLLQSRHIDCDLLPRYKPHSLTQATRSLKLCHPDRLAQASSQHYLPYLY